MSEEEQHKEQGTDSEETLPASVPESVIALKTGIPPQIQRSFWKAVGRVFAAATEIPAAWLEGKAHLIRAKSQAEVDEITSRQAARKLIEAESAKSAALQLSRPELAQRALEYHAAHLVREQSNREKVVEIAAEEIAQNPPKEDAKVTLDEDWLELFLKEASTRSNSDFQLLFGKILAGEIANPGTFSVAAIQILGRLTKETAQIFQTMCNLSTVVGNARVVSNPFGHAGENSLKDFGLSYNVLACLVENGLVRPDFSEWNAATKVFYTHNIPFDHAGRKYWLARKPGVEDGSLPDSIRLEGPSLTQAGRELRSIVPMERSLDYIHKLGEWFQSQNLILYETFKEEGQTLYGRPVPPLPPNS